ncbi:Protein of unknown function [Streptococcus thermophilus]|nr:Protein of unknown function [Streptococcus thermophilus]
MKKNQRLSSYVILYVCIRKPLLILKNLASDKSSLTP